MNTTAGTEQQVSIEALSAVTLAVRDMRASVSFYETLGFQIKHGGADEDFTSFACGASFLNLIAQSHGPIAGWGRFIVHVSDVDRVYSKALEAGLTPSLAPSDAPWGERYFHISDPDGHELSVAKPLG
jgi:catechol 2,3-dioxygenase-like lactoylglutathione lyase family enzyme